MFDTIKYDIKKKQWSNQLLKETALSEKIVSSICDYFQEIGYTSDNITIYEINERKLSFFYKYPEFYAELNNLLIQMK